MGLPNYDQKNDIYQRMPASSIAWVPAGTCIAPDPMFTCILTAWQRLSAISDEDAEIRTYYNPHHTSRSGECQ